MYRPSKTLIVAAVTAAAFTLIGATTAYAVTTSRSGSTTSKQYIIDQQADWTMPAGNTWQDVPGAAVTVYVPPGTTRMINARFTAESKCTSAAYGYCSVRIVYVPVGKPAVELSPQIESDGYAFDMATSADVYGARTVERATKNFLSPGYYTVRVQARSFESNPTFRLDDYVTHVDLINP